MLDLLILQPTPFCNINCDYCYLPARQDTSRMSMQTLDVALRRVIASGLVGSDLSVVWHAGEPLVLSVAYYREAFRVIEKQCPAEIRVRHSMQSNGMLLTDEWCNFIRERGINIGLSIDGPDWLHDAHRRTRAGKGTHAAAMKGLDRLHRHGIPFHVICVLTRDSLCYPDEIFDFFVGRGVRRLGFNVEEIEGEHKSSSLAAEHVQEAFERFFDRVIERLQAGSADMRVREVDEVLMALRHPSFGVSTSNCQNSPLEIISIAWNGEFSTFSPELLGHNVPDYGSFSFGNLHACEIQEIFQDERFQRIWTDIAHGVAECQRTCQYFDFCRGGAPSNKLAEHGHFGVTETLFCRLRQKVVINSVLRAVEQTLDEPTPHSTLRALFDKRIQ